LTRFRIFMIAPLVFCVAATVALGQSPSNAITGQVPFSQHVFLIVLENYSYDTITSPSDPSLYMPNVVSLGTTYGHATNYVTNSSGSLLDYLWLSSGYCHSDPNTTADCVYPPFPAGVAGLHDFGCTGGACVNPATQDYWPITDTNIYRLMINHTPSPITWKLYAESLPYAGYTGDRQDPPSPYSAYDPHHNPPLWYSDVGRHSAQAAQQLNMVPFTQFVTDLANNALPQYSIIIPNDDHDAHDGTPQAADDWLQANVFTPLLSQPFFQAGGDGLMIITFDNGDGDGAGQVYTAVIGPQVKPGYVSNTPFQHQDSLLTILQALGLAGRPGFSAIATGFGEFFNVAGPVAQLSSTKLFFGAQAVGSTTNKSFTLTNTGAAALAIGSIGITAGDFTQTNDCGSSLAVGAFCTISVAFTPSSAGVITGKVTITDSLAPAQAIALTGTGTNPKLTIIRVGTGFGTVSDGTSAINCGSTCSAQFPIGSVVTLTPTPLAGSRFSMWGPGCSGNPCSITINGNTTVKAYFGAILPSRPTTAVLDSSSALASGIAGLFLMNEGTGTIDRNVVNGQTASFSGAQLPTWYAGDHSVTFLGGAPLNSYLDAGTDLSFDQLPVNQITIVAKVLVPTFAAGGIAEKNDGNSGGSGFVFGLDASGGLHLTVERKSVNMRVATPSKAVVVSKWQQVAFTWDGTVGSASAAHIFVNGVEQAKTSSSDGSGPIQYKSATGQPFRIGTAGFDSMAGSLNGRIAYLAVYNGRILTPTELNQLDTKLPIKAQ
jgi:hypothetical protein